MDDLNQLILNLTTRTDCFWSKHAPGSLQFCEEQNCSFIVSPAETWTNILYFLVGFFILRSLPKARAFGWIAILVGICSTLFHASHTLWAETLDLAAMNVFGGYLIARNFDRLFSLSHAFFKIIFLGVTAISSIALFFLWGEARLNVFGSLVAIVFGTETVLFFRGKKKGRPIFPAPYIWYAFTFALFAVAYLFWQLDFRMIACDPKNHFISGHGGWHLLNAFCFYTLARFYEGYNFHMEARKPD